MGIKKVFLSAGHTEGYNKGCIAGYYEGTKMYEYSLLLKKEFEAQGVQVSLARNSITDDPGHTARGKAAAASGADLHLMLHTDAAGESAKGVTAIYSVERPNDEPHAEYVGKAVAQTMGTTFRKIWARPGTKNPKKDYYTEINVSVTNGMDHVLDIEHGFHTNPQDCSWWMTAGNPEKMAKAVAKACMETFGGTSNAAPIQPQQPSVSAKTFTLTRLLTNGSKGEDVKSVQNNLVAYGYNCGNAGIDGIFGSGTLSAVKAFQKAKGLSVDGKVGQKTAEALGGVWKPAVSSFTVSRILKKGVSGEDVRPVQNALIAKGYSCGRTGADGKFGANTESAVKAFQKANGLSVDGKVGEKTTQALGGTWKQESYAFTLSRLLVNGSKGDDVKAVQSVLISKGYSCGSAGADGIFGSGTLAAVKAFQKAKGLSVDGKVGEKTTQALGGKWAA